MTAQEIIEEQIPVAIKKRPEVAAEINAIIHFNITGADGGHWTMDLTRKDDWIQHDFQGNAVLTITISNDDFVKLRCGELNGAAAVMTGRLQFNPFNFPMAMKVAKLMG